MKGAIALYTSRKPGDLDADRLLMAENRGLFMGVKPDGSAAVRAADLAGRPLESE